MNYEISKFRPCSDAIKFREKFETFEEAWEQCPRGDWMLWIASKLNVNERKLVFAKALCANTIRHLMRDERSINAIDISIRFGNNEANHDELKIAAKAAHDAVYDITNATVNATANAAYYVANAADYTVNAAYYDAHAAYYAAKAAYATVNATAYAANANANATNDAINAEIENQNKTADICREILTEEVLSKI